MALRTHRLSDRLSVCPPVHLCVCPAYQSDIIKVGLLRCREEPPKLLQGTRFQERTFQIKDRKLLLLKDKKVGGS